MKYFKYILVLVCCVLIVSACDSIDFGDVNQDNDSVPNGNTESLMASAMDRFFTLGGRSYIAIPTLNVQYQSQITYTSEQRYTIVSRAWGAYYVQTLSNLKRVIELNSGNADDIPQSVKNYGAPVNQKGVAELMSAFIWKQLTDTYGPVPYKEALKDDNDTPAYTSQQEIYKDLFKKVASARDALDSSKKGPSGDVVYGGDVTKWKKFANSLLMSMAIQVSEASTPNIDEQKVFNDALDAGPIEEVSDEFWYQYQNKPGAENPFTSLRGADYAMSLPATEALRGTSSSVTYNGSPVIGYSNTNYDARLNVYAAEPDSNGRPYGREALEASNTPGGLTKGYTSVYAGVSNDKEVNGVTGTEAPLPYMTAAYTYLNRAEAANKSWGTGESATAMFEKGVKMSYKTIDAHWDDGDATTGRLQSDGSTFATNRLSDAPMEQLIAEEKWAALFPMGFQAWSEWRRTGYPDLVPSLDAVNNGNIPTRYPYPGDEPGVNSENYKKGVDMLSNGDKNTSTFWWDQ